MPKWEILQLPDLPDTIFFDVLILVETTLPPLNEAAGMGILDAFVGSGAHECTKTAQGSSSILGDVDDILQLGVVEEKAMDRTVPSLDKIACEPSNI